MTEPTTVLIADDHPVFRADLEVVGEASSGDDAVALAVDLLPDTVVMDLNMPGGINGVEATARIAERAPGVQVLILTMFDDDESVFAAVRAGRPATCSRMPSRTMCCARSGPWPVETLCSDRAWHNVFGPSSPATARPPARPSHS